MIEEAVVVLKLFKEGRRLFIEGRRDAEAAAAGMTKFKTNGLPGQKHASASPL